MGDVYEAMNRARREQAGEGPAAKPADTPLSAPPAADPAAEPSGLPLDQVQAVALVKELATPPARGNGRGRSAPQPQVTPAPEDEQAQAQDQDHDEASNRTPAATPGHDQDEAPAADVKRGPAALPKDPTVRIQAGEQSRAAHNGYARNVVVHHDRGSVVAEQYRAIRLQLLNRARNRRVQAHAITSSSPQEGKTVTTVNLGLTFSELAEARTLLVEGDLRRPAFGRELNADTGPGLVQLLRDEERDLDRVIYPTVYGNLDFLPAGGRCTESTELLASPRMAEVLEKLRGRYDHILIDTPPVIHLTDACILGGLCDDVLLVIRLNKTPVEVVDRAKRLLRASHCEIAGVVLTHQRYHIPNYLYQYV